MPTISTISSSAPRIVYQPKRRDWVVILTMVAQFFLGMFFILIVLWMIGFIESPFGKQTIFINSPSQSPSPTSVPKPVSKP